MKIITGKELNMLLEGSLLRIDSNFKYLDNRYNHKLENLMLLITLSDGTFWVIEDEIIVKKFLRKKKRYFQVSKISDSDFDDIEIIFFPSEEFISFLPIETHESFHISNLIKTIGLAENPIIQEKFRIFKSQKSKHQLSDFDSFRKQFINLIPNQPYKCDVFKDNGQKLINNENGYLIIKTNEILLETYDGSNDYISFYNNQGMVFCKYVILNGEVVALNEAINKIELINRENDNRRIVFESSK